MLQEVIEVYNKLQNYFLSIISLYAVVTFLVYTLNCIIKKSNKCFQFLISYHYGLNHVKSIRNTFEQIINIYIKKKK